MSINESYFDRWQAFGIKSKPRKNPIKIFFQLLKWIFLVSSVVIFFWGMGTLFFNQDVTASQVEVLNDQGEMVKEYKSGVFFEVISGYDDDLTYKQHIFSFQDGDLYEYDYLSVKNTDDMWEYSKSAFYVVFVLPISWILTKITEFLGWNKNDLASNHNLMVMIFGIFLTSLILRIITGVGSWKQQQKQQKMKLLQGRVSEIKDKYKEDTSLQGKQKMQMEIMAIYRQEKINPLASSLEGFAFAPLLFAMFVVVRTSRILKESGTTTFSLTNTIWDSITAGAWVYLIPVLVYLILLGIDIFLLPLFLKTKPKKKIIQKAVPDNKIKTFLFKWGFKLLFIVFFFLVPTGTSVYWIFSSFFEILQKLLLAFVQKIQKQKIIAQKRGENFNWWNIKTLSIKN